MTVSSAGQETVFILWDLAGEPSQQKVPRSYFHGADAVVFVFDLSRPATFRNMDQDLAHIRSVVPGALFFTVGNKSDLIEEAARKKAPAAAPEFITSARTGKNTATLFQAISQRLLDRR
jgi:GTPase SAR1 family protein